MEANRDRNILGIARLRDETTRQLTTFDLASRAKTVQILRGHKVTLGEDGSPEHSLRYAVDFAAMAEHRSRLVRNRNQPSLSRSAQPRVLETPAQERPSESPDYRSLQLAMEHPTTQTLTPAVVAGCNGPTATAS